MNIEEFTSRFRGELRRNGLPTPFVDVRRPGSVKIRVRLRPNLHISLYFNEQTGTVTSALVKNNRRIFGYDAYPERNRYHIHPINHADEHQESRELPPEEIVEAYVHAMRESGLL